MSQGDGYVHPKFPQYVCRLKKALYGLKQATRAWNERISQYLQSVGFVVGKADHSLFVKKIDTDYVVIVIYVDDLILTGSDEHGIADIKAKLKNEFDMKDLGDLKFFLGIEVMTTPTGIWLMQRQYALNMLEKFGMKACKPMDTPLDQNLKLMADSGSKVEDVTMYQQMVGSLIYLTISRPDLAYAVGLIS